MKPEEITALAREYAEGSLILSEDMPNCLRNEYLKLFADEVERVIRFLLRRFCLVEKEAVRKEYQDARSSAREGYKAKLGTMIAVSESRKALLESLFPDLRKEVEE